jgi:YVTN family beta-propeller protein
MAGLTVLPANGARADTAATLPISAYYQMVVDSTNDHLFFSQGSSTGNSILVTDFAGNTVATISGQNGVMGIAISPDGSTLYAALSGANAVSAISTSTLTETARYELPAGDAPYSVAVQSGKLWVSYDAGTTGAASIGDFDLSAATPSLEAQSAMGGWYSAPTIAADPSGTDNVLVALQDGLSPSAAASYDTSQDPVTVRATAAAGLSSSAGTCSNAMDLATRGLPAPASSCRSGPGPSTRRGT